MRRAPRRRGRGGMRSAPALVLALWIAAAAAAHAGGAPDDAPDPVARMPQGDAAAEHWDLAARFTSGHRLYARFMITNQGPGDGTAVALGHVVTPEGRVVGFQNGRRAGAWRLGPGGRFLDIGSSELHFEPGVRRLVVDNRKRHFELVLSLPDDGSGRRAPTAPGGTRLDLLNLASPARGRLRIGATGSPVALEGRAVLTHTWSGGGERQNALRRIDVATFRDDRNLFLSAWQAASGARWQWLVLTAHDAVPRGPLDFALELDEPEGPSAYPVPQQLRMRGKHINGSIALGGKSLLGVDPLDALPTVLKLLYSFGSPRHVWHDASLDVTVLRDRDTPGSEEAAQGADAASQTPQPPPWRIEGPALASIFFVDTVPPKPL